jgi:alpha-beta hydrolase superfamily lysophospholipase
LRPFEIYLAIACVAAIVWPALFGVRPRRGILVVVLLGMVVLQWQIEGFRWPLLLLYLVAVGLAVGDFVTLERTLPWYRRAGRGVFGILGLAAVVAPALLFPVPRLPVPSGPLSIGTATVELTHPELRETYGPTPGGRRSLTTQIWYPAADTEGVTPERWIWDMDVVGSALAEHLRVPGFLFNSARYTDSHAHPDVPVDAGGFPLVVFSHGWAEFRTISLPQVENLVSQGYVVIAIDHPHAAVATRVGEEIVRLDPTARGEEDADEEAIAEAEAALIETMAADVTLVLDEVTAGREGAYGRLAEAIDAGMIGVWGHGLGGGAALQVCLLDERCDAVAAQDPVVETLPDQILATTAIRPMLLMRSDPWRDTANDAVLRGMVARSETLTYWVGVRGADSSDFVATPVISPIADRIGLRGPIDADRVMVINRRYLTGFFDRFLLGTGPAALDTAAFPEVDVEVIDQG